MINFLIFLFKTRHTIISWNMDKEDVFRMYRDSGEFFDEKN